jgi:hypothetical protein
MAATPTIMESAPSMIDPRIFLREAATSMERNLRMAKHNALSVHFSSRSMGFAFINKFWQSG